MPKNTNIRFAIRILWIKFFIEKISGRSLQLCEDRHSQLNSISELLLGSKWKMKKGPSSTLIAFFRHQFRIWGITSLLAPRNLKAALKWTEINFLNSISRTFSSHLCRKLISLRQHWHWKMLQFNRFIRPPYSPKFSLFSIKITGLSIINQSLGLLGIIFS